MVVHEEAVLESQGEIVATAMTLHSQTEGPPFEDELGWLAGDPAHGGMGLGRAICAVVIAQFIEEGFREIHLYTEDWRLPTLKTNLKLGYVPLLYTLEMPERWNVICAQLGWPLTPEMWQS